MNNTINYLGLQGILIDSFVENENNITISAHTTSSTQICPHCGKPVSFIHGYRTQKIKDLPMRLKNVIIVLKKRRYICKECNTTFFEKYSFLPKYDTLSDENKQALKIMLSQNEDLYTAWRLKENFKYLRQTTTKQDAERELLSWILETEESELQEFKAATTAFHNWGKSIINSIIYKYSNGITEGFNNKIKVLKRNAYGYRNFDNFRKRIMLNCSKNGNPICI